MDKDKIKRIIEEVTTAMGITCSSIEEEQGPEESVWLSIESEDSPLLIGKDGENLRALNMLVKKIAEKNSLDTKFHLDVGGYNKKRIEKIKYSAQIAAERAKFLKEDIELPPASSYERMIVHSVLADDSMITTESTGVGRDRRIVIKYTPSEEQENF